MFIEVLLVSIAIAAYLWYSIQQKKIFFKNLNVKHVKNPPFNSIKDLVFRRKNLNILFEEFYRENDSSLVGYFEWFSQSPTFMIRHPSLINQILVSDFHHFKDHRKLFTGEHNGLLSNNLFSMKGQKWKDMRATLTNVFTGSKLRAMFELTRETAEGFVVNLKSDLAKGHSDVKTKDFFTRYANDIIATTAFGFQIDSMKDKDNSFLEMSKGVTNFGKSAVIKFFLMMQFPSLSNFLKIRLLPKKYTDFYRKLVIGAMQRRSEEKIIRPDMINILMEARDQQKWSDEELIAQSLIFVFSGFETVATVLCYISQELMENQDVQDKLKAEIQEVLRELNGGQLTYDTLNGMKYMDCVVSEALRKWPFQSAIDRECTKAIEIQDPETGESIQMRVGDRVSIPVFGLHRDPNHFPDPLKFQPERFSEENRHNIDPSTYLPFGAGPRMCIAHRFAYLEIKAMLFYMFSDLRVDVSERSTIPYNLEEERGHPFPKNGFWVKMVNDKK